MVGALVRRYGHFDACEDAVQEALVAAARQWPEQGPPDNPKAGSTRVAARRLTDQVRSDAARRRREDEVAGRESGPGALTPDVDESAASSHDDTLRLLFLCCHPSLTSASQIALTLRAVGGLTTGEIAHAFFVPEATMAQRISRAKQTIETPAERSSCPPPDALDDRLRSCSTCSTSSSTRATPPSGRRLLRVDLTTEAIRLTRHVHALRPDDGEVAGLLALMLLTDARRAARTTSDGALVPLAEQDRDLWDRALVDEGVDAHHRRAPSHPIGPYQLQAAIAAVHDEAPTSDDTDWAQTVPCTCCSTDSLPTPWPR